MDLGQVYTKSTVADYMVNMFNLTLDAHMFDPCFGTGAFLVSLEKKGYFNVEGNEIDSESFNAVKKDYPNIKCTNSDFLGLPEDRLYDGIIMNPPYIRQEKINDLSPLGITKKALRKNSIFDELPSTSNLYMYFILKAIQLLKSSGELVVIFPCSWMQTMNKDIFCSIIIKKCTILKTVFVHGEVFENDPLVDVMILHLKKGLHGITEKQSKIRINGNSIVKIELDNRKLYLGFDKKYTDIASVRRGLTTGCNSMFINPKLSDTESKDTLKDIISSPRDIEGYNANSAKLDLLLMVSDKNTSTEIREYINKWEVTIRDTGKPKVLLSRIIKNNKWYEMSNIDSEGILFGYFVRSNMKFIWNMTGAIARDNFYIIKTDIDYLLFFALLNNIYTYLQLELSGKRYGSGLLKLQRYDIERLRFPDIDKLTEAHIEELKSYSKQLIDSSDDKIVNKITKVLSVYSIVDYETVHSFYSEMKNRRLEL